MTSTSDLADELTPDRIALLCQAFLAFKRAWLTDNEANARIDFGVAVLLFQKFVESRDG